MNELLQKHGCTNVFTIPEGLKELMSDITREVLREQPLDILDFITNYLSVLLITREHGILAVRILDDLCDCKPSVSEHLLQLGLEKDQTEILSQTIKEEIEGFEPDEGKESVKEIEIVKKILKKTMLDEEMTAKVCQVARNAYRDYWYRKKLLEKDLETHPREPWEVAAEHTLELYKRTKPSFSELTRATLKIQAAYRGYHVRKKLLRYLKPRQKMKKRGPKTELPGPPLDISGSREIDLGPLICICDDLKVKEDDVSGMFDEIVGEQLGLQYDPTKTITHVEDEEQVDVEVAPSKSTYIQEKSGTFSAKSSIHELDRKRSKADESREIGLASKVEIGSARKSRAVSIMPQPGRKSVLPSQMSESKQSKLAVKSEDLHKISFSDTTMVIKEPAEIHETVAEDIVDENIPADSTVEAETEPAQEIPEDIADDHTEDEGESAPTTSVLTTAETADDTDLEDVGEDITTTEDEQ